MKKTKVSIAVFLMFALLFCFSGCAAAESIYDDETAITDIFDTSIATRYVENYLKIGNQITVNSHAKYFSGTQKICEFYFDQATDIDVELTVTQGRFKIVLISEEKDVYTLYENGSDLLIDLAQIPDGNYIMKFVGQQAEFDLDMTVNLD